MDFGNSPKLAAISPASPVPRSEVSATPGGVTVDLAPEQTVQSAKAGDAVRVDVSQRDRRDLPQEAKERRSETDRVKDRERREADQRAADVTDVIQRRIVIEPTTRTVVLQKTNTETGETVQTLPDEATLKLRLYSREITERARLSDDATARYVERTA